MGESELQPARHRNASSWSRRLPVLGLALGGCAIATYLTAYQWGLTRGVWDPLFGDGSEAVLTSGVARGLPIPDATLGALAYLLEAVIGAIGSTERWRAMPWIVVAFGLMLAGLAFTSLCLVIAQPVFLHTGCTLCLVSAAISFVNAWIGQDEVRASLRYLQRTHADGHSAWQALWGKQDAPERTGAG